VSEVTDEATTDFPATLDLSSADTSTNKMENGWKEARVAEVTPIVTDNPQGRLPMGTPGINVMFRIDGGPYNERPVWNRYWFPPAGYDEEKRAKSLGMFARFLMAIGYPEDQVKSEGFKIDINDMLGRECRVNTKYNEEYDNNNVAGVKPRQAVPEGAGAGIL
jgi:hypothetical protein